MTDYISFSGGIDSTALTILHPDAVPIFSDTQWEFPELYQHIEKVEKTLGREILRISGGSLPEYIQEQRFFPNFRARFCTRIFKIEPINEFLKSELPCNLMIGLRYDEPMRVGNLSEFNGLGIKYPLREEKKTREDCVNICRMYDLLPLYPPYMRRGGCVGCYFKSKVELRAMMALCPSILDEIEALEESVQDNRGNFFHMFPNVRMGIKKFRAQGTLFDMSCAYETTRDMEPCGLFCRK